MEGSPDFVDTNKLSEAASVKDNREGSPTKPVIPYLSSGTQHKNITLPMDNMMAMMYYQSAMLTSMSQQGIANLTVPEKLKSLVLENTKAVTGVNKLELGVLDSLDTDKWSVPSQMNSNLCADDQQHGDYQVMKPYVCLVNSINVIAVSVLHLKLIIRHYVNIHIHMCECFFIMYEQVLRVNRKCSFFVAAFMHFDRLNGPGGSSKVM